MSATTLESDVALGIDEFGLLGVAMGMRHLEPIFDEEEAAELRRFRSLAVAIMLAGTATMALGSG